MSYDVVFIERLNCLQLINNLYGAFETDDEQMCRCSSFEMVRLKIVNKINHFLINIKIQ